MAPELILADVEGHGDARLDEASLVGTKAKGLGKLPPSWRPPYAVLPTSCFEAWRHAEKGRQEGVLAEAAAALHKAAAEWLPAWPRGIILRSSASGETLRDRGAFESRKLPADYDAASIAGELRQVFERFQDGPSATAKRTPDALAIVLQPLVPQGWLGHISNERRVSKTVNQWVWEIMDPNHRVTGFNSQRDSPPDPAKPLLARSRDIKRLLRSVGRWCTNLKLGRTHLELAGSADHLWILQLDFEDDSPDDGVDPHKLLRPEDLRPPGKIAGQSAVHLVDLAGLPIGWNKLDKTKVFLGIRKEPYPPLHYIEGSVLAVETGDAGLIRDLNKVTHGRAVCRTDCRSPGVGSLNLPRTDSVSPERAVDFMREELHEFRQRGVAPEDVCFILHKFIPACACAWARAAPGEQIVLVDSLWGVPDGLQYLSHDSFQYDVRREKISAERIRYKPTFIQEREDGSWCEIKVARRFARTRSLSAADVAEVAQQTHAIALKDGRPTLVMWFCTIPDAVGYGRNLPWFRMEANPHPGMKASGRVTPRDPRRTIRSQEDLEAASVGEVLVLAPNIDLIRDETFLKEVIRTALQNDNPVELAGTSLAHAFYELERGGITVVPADEDAYSRVRGRRVFDKIVRDRIPERIESGGERVLLAHIRKSETRAALAAKLLEEVHELLDARSPEDVSAELSDLLEVVRALASATGVSWQEVERIAEEKRQQRGGFDGGTVLLGTAWPGPGTSDGAQQGGARAIGLKDLARVSSSAAEVTLNYASLFANGANPIVCLPDGNWVRVTLSPKGVKLILEKGGDPKAQRQYALKLR